MPISNNASYIPTMNIFDAHWVQVDAALGTGLVVTREDTTPCDRSTFNGLINALNTQNNAVIGALNDQELARGDIEMRKAAVLVLLGEALGLLDAYWQGTIVMNARPMAPSVSDGQDSFLKPVEDMADLWVKMNAGPVPSGLTLPMILSDGTTASDFAGLASALRGAYRDEAKAQQALTLARADRDQIKTLAYTAMKAYRQAVPPRCRQHPTLVDTLPRLTPLPGHTPDPVNASAVFESPDKSKVVYTASTDADLERYDLRGNPGTTYDDADAVVIDTHTPQDPLEIVSPFGLTQPGSKVALKIFVVLTTGNEAGSATMVVERPV